MMGLAHLGIVLLTEKEQEKTTIQFEVPKSLLENFQIVGQNNKPKPSPEGISGLPTRY